MPHKHRPLRVAGEGPVFVRWRHSVAVERRFADRARAWCCRWCGWL